MYELLNSLDITRRWKLFLITFIAGFLMVSLPYLGVRIPKFFAQSSQVSPLAHPEDPIIQVRPKLEIIKNDFRLTKPTSLIKSAQAGADYDLASAYIMLDLDSGQVLASKNSGKRLAIASLTKVMTALVALDLASPDEILTVSKSATEVIPTRMGVVEGQKWTLGELLHALLLTSANDAAEAIKQGIDQKMGGDGVFVSAMNAKASFLNLHDSHFQNPQGFDARDQFSNAEDLSSLSAYALKNYPLIAEIAKKDYQFFPATQTHKQADLYNWNGLIGVYPGILGLKIGNTDDAEKTTIVISERDGHKILAVLLGAPGVLERDLWASELLDLGFNKGYGLSAVNITEDQLKAKYKTWKYFN